jgi:hypothetical protein
MTGLTGREGGAKWDGTTSSAAPQRPAQRRKHHGTKLGGSRSGTAFFVEGQEPGRPTALSTASDVRADVACAEIVALAATPVGHRVVISALTEVLTTEVDRVWRRGWQPADLCRVVGRSLDSNAQVVLADAWPRS